LVEITRRDFLKLLGISTAGVSVGVLAADSILSVPDDVFKRAVAGPHIETWKNSICSLCPGGCGIRVRLIDGIPVRVTGNPLYPVNRGAVCPMAEAGVEALFHPDRLRQPLKRTGNRGDGEWQAILWDEALEMVSSRLRQLRESGTPEKLVFVSQDHNDMMADFANRFMQAFGSPNFLLAGYGQLHALPSLLTHGWDRPAAYDLTNTNFVLNFGGNFLDEEPTPVRFNQIYAALRSRKNSPRGRIVHIDSYMSRTAIHSSDWIPLRPGTMAALALGIAHVMVKDRSYDRDFVDNHTFGFSNWQDSAGKWRQGFKSLVDEEYYPEKVAELTNVPAKKIVELARDFAAAKPALAIAGGQAAASTNSLYTLWAIYCLNALKGNFEKPGGVLFPKDLKKFSPAEPAPDQIAVTGLQKPKIGHGERSHFSFAVDSVHELARALREYDPPPFDTLILHRANPLFESANQKDLTAALQKVPFIVSCTPFMDETASFADLILPDQVFLEKWEISHSVPTIEFSHLGVQQPVIAPLYDTRHTGDVLLQMAQRLGGSVASSLPWADYKTYLQAHAKEIFNSGEGTIVSETVELSWIEFLKKRGWQVFDYSTFDEFWEVLLEKGGWWDPTYPKPSWSRIFKTPSGWLEFFSRRL
jgi:anaerobic selenocysteine-containing dehydrogenase